ncbi:helix-turn-helix transcriptional regulator [Halomonas binhaiensis]|uniref:Helix-turn-helix transcriptional regulator n=1 Tax=Halomonas binhaiensis TaxID=2562282 RepID=A0A5C1NEV9_9GAMM|nr:helix-turn-helix transcriptional regulator [Halomonas binhaiensis]QEM81754.1 helix-turn-helix transcriptional regulator [Halomonas binhaiensis]
MTFHQQLMQRRQQLKLTQAGVAERIGMSRQQYQSIERNGNPRLDTLELLAQGLNAELMLIPREKLAAVARLLTEDDRQPSLALLNVDPWHGLLDSGSDDEDGP